MAANTINLKELSTYEKEDLIKDFVSNPDENVSEDEAQTALANLFLDAQLNNLQTLFEKNLIPCRRHISTLMAQQQKRIYGKDF